MNNAAESSVYPKKRTEESNPSTACSSGRPPYLPGPQGGGKAGPQGSGGKTRPAPPLASLRGLKSPTLMSFFSFFCAILFFFLVLVCVCQFFYGHKRQSPTKVHIGFAK